MKSEIELNNIFIISEDYEGLKLKFGSPSSYGNYYLFEKSGALVTTGKNNVGYERGVKIFLKQLIKQEYFAISDFIKVNENIKNIDWLSNISAIIENENKDYFIISLFLPSENKETNVPLMLLRDAIFLFMNVSIVFFKRSKI